MSDFIVTRNADNQVSVTYEGEALLVGESIKLGFGSVELRKSKKGYSLVRLTRTGEFAHAVKIGKPGRYVVNANGGYRAVSPEEETDAIKRVLRERHVSVKALREFSDDIMIPNATLRAKRQDIVAEVGNERLYTTWIGGDAVQDGENVIISWSAALITYSVEVEARKGRRPRRVVKDVVCCETSEAQLAKLLDDAGFRVRED